MQNRTRRTFSSRITVCNRGPEAAQLQVLPHLWFRNTWYDSKRPVIPTLTAMHGIGNVTLAEASHHDLGDWLFHCDGDVPLLFTNNETNRARFFFSRPIPTPYVKGRFPPIRHRRRDRCDQIRPGREPRWQRSTRLQCRLTTKR